MRATVTACASSVAGIVCLAVVVRERGYRHSHPFALGPSGYIVALGVAGLLLSACIAWAAIAELTAARDRRWQHRVQSLAKDE